MENDHITDVAYYGDQTDFAITWTSRTDYNLIVGCSPAGAECDHCYAADMAHRQATKLHPGGRYDGLVDLRKGAPRFNGAIGIADRDKWVKAVSGCRRELVFANSMGDPFHHNVPDALLLHFFRTMHLANWKVWQVCTKRGARMADFMSRLHERDGRLHLAESPLPNAAQAEIGNVWLGVTAGTQVSADKQIAELLKVKATVRFVSMEPLLEQVDIGKYIGALDWIIVGGESGPDWRPMDLDWARSIRDCCVERRVPFFFKQVAGKNPENMSKELDGIAWRQLPRRKLACLPSAKERKTLRAWAIEATIPGLEDHLPPSHSTTCTVRLSA
jgi:protein gp37